MPQPGRGGPSGRRDARWVLLLLVACGTVAISVWGVSLPAPSVWPLLARQPVEPAADVRTEITEPLPVPRATEHYLSRARVWLESGRLRDSLRELDRVPVGDPGRAEADRLRARIQRELLAIAAAEPAFPPVAGEPPAPPGE